MHKPDSSYQLPLRDHGMRFNRPKYAKSPLEWSQFRAPMPPTHCQAPCPPQWIFPLCWQIPSASCAVLCGIPTLVAQPPSSSQPARPRASRPCAAPCTDRANNRVRKQNVLRFAKVIFPPVVHLTSNISSIRFDEYDMHICDATHHTWMHHESYTV